MTKKILIVGAGKVSAAKLHTLTKAIETAEAEGYQVEIVDSIGDLKPIKTQIQKIEMPPICGIDFETMPNHNGKKKGHERPYKYHR